MTQIDIARQGRVSDAMKRVAQQEHRSVAFIRKGVANGTIVIPANHNHTTLVPCGIGRKLSTKINANIGNSTVASCPKAEMDKLNVALKYGADTVMDLSTQGDLGAFRKRLMAHCPVAVGTVPIYEVVARYGHEDFTEQHILEVIEEQARQGVDYMTLHAGLLQAHIPLAKKRKLGIVSRGGALLALWMQTHNRENPFYTAFDNILAICHEHDVTLSLGDGLRPGCLADSSDAAQFAELETLGALVQRARAAGVQVMIEGPGHVPLNEIAMNMRKERHLCDDAPFYILGPIVTDCAPGYDHLVGSAGGMLGAYYGAAMLCYLTPKEHLGLPNLDDVRAGVVAFKIAAHAADVALKKPNSRLRDDAISDARATFDWEKQFEVAIDPEKARALRAEALNERTSSACQDERYCTMCGPAFCSIRLSQQLKATSEQ
jgi:phosphomethylpyrimidine synthase